jgi:hypothetical protein
MEQTEKQIEHEFRTNDSKFFDAATQNPDVRDRAGIPDGVNGASFIRSQKIQAIVDTNGAGLAGDSYDLYAVDWNVEFSSRTGVSPKARWYVELPYGNAPPGYGVVFDQSTIGQLAVGGLTLYVMEPGETPFPTDDPAKVGPVAPKKTIHVLFGDDIFSGTTRVVGKSFKMVYTAPELTAKGSVTQSEQVNYEHRNTLYWALNGDPPILSGASFPMESRLPAGSSRDMVKYPGSKVRSAYDGVLQSANIQLDNNRPSMPNFDPVLWRSGDKPVGSNQYYHLYYGPEFTNGVIPAETISNPKWDSNSDIHMAVFEGLPKEATFQVSRMITVESFPSATSDLIAFAKPSPLANPTAITNAMNAVRSENRFWAASDNDFGNFAKALKKGVSKVSKAALNVAAIHPASAGYVAAARTAPKLAKSNPEENARHIANIERMLASANIGSGSGFKNEVGFAQPKAKRKRTKPTKQMKTQNFN